MYRVIVLPPFLPPFLSLFSFFFSCSYFFPSCGLVLQLGCKPSYYRSPTTEQYSRQVVFLWCWEKRPLYTLGKDSSCTPPSPPLSNMFVEWLLLQGKVLLLAYSSIIKMPYLIFITITFLHLNFELYSPTWNT